MVRETAPRCVLGLILVSMLACAKPASRDLSGQWIDLSYDFSSETVYWPTSEPFKLDAVSVGKTDKGYYYSAYKFSAAEHGGTHVDAPVHFAEGHISLDQLPMSQLISTAVRVDVSQKALDNRDYQVGVEDFAEWESTHGRIPDGAIVLVYTGYGRYWPDRIKYMGTDKRGAEAVGELHFPGLHPEAARWLTENRKINAVGLDTPSVDYGQSQYFESHRALADRDIPIFENVANLDKVPLMGALVVAMPMKIKGGSGGPLRIAALIPSSN